MFDDFQPHRVYRQTNQESATNGMFYCYSHIDGERVVEMTINAFRNYAQMYVSTYSIWA